MLKHRVIFGPPGTGKTRHLLEMVRAFVDGYAGKVCFCSHTRAAAQEALSRWPAALADRVDIQTLHSLCFRALKLSKAQTVDQPKLDGFGAEFGLDMSEEGLGKEFMEVLSLARSKCVSVDEGYERSWRPGSASHFQAFQKSYEQWKSVYGYKDFNDMLYEGALKLRTHDVNYALVVIDEAQDLTPLHWRMIYRMVELLPETPFLVAGDDDQSLYSFAGADPLGMRDFGLTINAEEVVLAQSYRITEQVHGLAQAIINQVQKRVPKEYYPRLDARGLPAQGKCEVWPHFDYLQVDPARDSLLLYADRFVRREVEPMLQGRALRYSALNGWPAPLDTRAARTLSTVFVMTDVDILSNEDARNEVRGGLSRYGADIWDRVSPREVLARIRRQDFSVLAIKPGHAEYFQILDWVNLTPAIRISTMHGAKGLQGDDVHLILSLSTRAWQEAAVEPDHLHRLIYTAVTRTKENLYIYDGENGYELPAEYR